MPDSITAAIARVAGGRSAADAAPVAPDEPVTMTFDGFTWTHVPESVGQHWSYWRRREQISTAKQTAKMDTIAALEESTDPRREE